MGQSMTNFKFVAVPGGPCAGKTTITDSIGLKLTDLGITTITVPEAATQLMLSGVTASLVGPEAFQRAVMRQTRANEDLRLRVAALAAKSMRVVVLADRGIPDMAAYSSAHDFERILGEEGMTLVDARDARYDAAVFLRSVAYDAPQLYTCENNRARLETDIEVARRADERTLEAWVGHPHLRILDNSTDLAGKRARALEAVCRVLDIPAPLEIERKFLVLSCEVSRIPMPVQPVHIVQYYLTSVHGRGAERVRARSQGGGVAYYHTRKRKIEKGVREEIERRITHKEYLELLARADPAFGKIEKTRYCFVWKDQYLELDVFNRPRGLILLEHELSEMSQETIIPDFITGKVKEVTDDPEFENQRIAWKLAHPLYN